MNTQRAAVIQAVLEGVELPATRDDLIAYARDQEPDVVADLEGLPDEEFRRLDEVGELLTRVPAAPAPPQKAIKKAAELQKRQQAEQSG